MFDLLSTLMKGANARATEQLMDHFALDLIQQKIREAESGIEAAKQTLASLMLRERQQRRALDHLKARKADLESRARSAIAKGEEVLAHDAAAAIADLENEENSRSETLARLAERTMRMRLSLEKANRRLIDLRQGALTAQAIDMERRAQGRLNRALSKTDAMREAEALIRRVTDADDTFEQSEVLDSIDRSLSKEDIADRLAAAGHGRATRTTADEVLARLRNAN